MTQRAPLAQELTRAARAIEALAAGRSLQLALDRVLAEPDAAVPPASHAAIRDLAWRTCREFGLVRELARLLNARPPAAAPAALQWVALAQMVGRVRPDAVLVDETVQAARTLPGGQALSGFLNATLRRFGRERELLLATARRAPEARWNHPAWWITRLREAWPQDWERILAAGNAPAPLTLRVNRRRTTVDDWLGRLDAAGLAGRRVGAQAVALDRAVPVHTLPGWSGGLLSVQDAGAQLAAPLLDPHDGERILDACAAPGGKSTHLLELADVELVALDSDAARLGQVRENLDRLGLKAHCLAGDAAQPEQWWDGRPFDRILVDAPCTASGILRRRPDARWLRRRGDPATLAQRQQAILQALWPTLRPGGTLLYVTCSVFPEEGEWVLAHFLDAYPDALRESLWFDPGSGAVGADDGDGRRGEPLATLLPAAEAARDHDGFFFARLRKRS